MAYYDAYYDVSLSAEDLWTWVEALRSGKYTQLQGGFIDYSKKKYCCLGVKCDLDGHVRNDNVSPVPSFPDEKDCGVFIRLRRRGILVALNDNGELDHYRRVIADLEGAAEDWITR